MIIVAKEQSMRMTPEGLVNWHPEGGIRNANVPESYNHIICALKNGKKHIMCFILGLKLEESSLGY